MEAPLKVERDDGSVLVLRPGGGWILLLIGAAMVVTTLFVVYLLGQSATLTCQRTAGDLDCHLNRAVLGITFVDRPLGRLVGAQVSTSEDSDGDPTYRVELQTQRDRVPLTLHWSSGCRAKQAMVQDIEAFLGDATATTLTTGDSGTVGLTVAGILLLTAVGLTVGGVRALNTTWTFDRIQHVIVKERRSLSGPRTWAYGLDEVTGVRVGSSRDSDGDRTYRVELQTVQGETIPLTSWFTSGYQRKAATADLIAAYLLD
jgi:hypothetical protein